MSDSSWPPALYLLLSSLVTSLFWVCSSEAVLRIGPACPCQQLISYLRTHDSVLCLLLFFIIYTVCPTQSRATQFWKSQCNSIHIKSASLSASPSPKSSIFTDRPPWAYLLPSCLLSHKKTQHCYHGTFKELTDLRYKLSIVFPFFSVCWLFSCLFLTRLFLRAETLLRKHLACMEKCLTNDYYIMWLHKANIFSSCFIPKCVFRSVLERFQIITFSQQTMLCEIKSFK